MDALPSNIVFDIFSRIPVKSLARNRCVSKQWCSYIDDRYLVLLHGERVVEEPTPIMCIQNPLTEKLERTLTFHIITSKQCNTGNQSHVVLESKKAFEFVCKKPLSTTSLVTRVQPRASCNGLVVIAQDNGKVITNFYAIHPLRKECYELPPFPFPFPLSMSCYLTRGSCGLGFDVSTNTLKMVCVLLKKPANPKNPDLVRTNLCTMVHVFGTNSWKEIQKVPSYPVQGEAKFAHGCLHWLVNHLDNKTNDVILFDVTKEEFGLISSPPKTTGVIYLDRHLVDLNGKVGLVCNTNVTMEVWVLQHKEWVIHCQFDPKPHFLSWRKVLGSWNKEGDISIEAGVKGIDRYFVYKVKSGDIYEVDIVVGQRDNCQTGMIMYPNSLFSIHGINTNSNSIRSQFI